jgi:YD repeat-containing protein
MSWQLPVRSARLWGFISSVLLYAVAPAGGMLAPLPAYALKCIQAGYKPEEGAVECHRSITTEVTWFAGIMCPHTGCVIGPTHNEKDMEAEAFGHAEEIVFCPKEHIKLYDYRPTALMWGGAGKDAEGNEVTLREFEKRYRTTRYYRKWVNESWVCTSQEYDPIDWSMYRREKALCPAGFLLYGWFYPEEGGDGSMVCGDPARTVNACQAPGSSRNTLAVGNPIEISTGAKMQAELVAPGNGTDLPDLIWHYNSRRAGFDGAIVNVGASGNPVLGVDQRPWRHNFDTFVVGSNAGIRPVGRVVRPAQARDAYFTKENGVLTSTYGEGDQLREVTDRPGIKWVYIGTDNTVDSFNDKGRLVLRQTADGKSLSFKYVQLPVLDLDLPEIEKLDYLRTEVVSEITTHAGRKLILAYDNQARIRQVTDVLGQPISFAYPDDRARRIARITFPDTKTRSYQYQGELNSMLTGITDENAQLYAEFGYDARGRAAFTQHAGGVNRFAVSYEDGRWGPAIAIITPNGGVAKLNVVAKGNWMNSSTYSPPMEALTSVSDPYPGCSNLPAHSETDAKGNLISRVDFNGSKTCFVNDNARQLVTKRIEGLAVSTGCTGALTTPPADARAVNTQWHPHWRLKTRESHPKLITTWVYNGQPDPTAGNAVASCAPASALVDGKPIAVVCKQVEQATTDANGAAGFAAPISGSARVWTYTYNQWGQVLTAKSPRTDVNDTTTYAYYTDTTAEHRIGDLKSVTNSVGHQTQYLRYNARGQVLSMSAPNGATSTFSYTPRGWLKTEATTHEGQTLTTVFDYDGVGQLKKSTSPDGSFVTYTYDAAHRLKETADNLGNRIAYTLDNLGNITAEESKDPAGTLRRRVARVFDSFSRVRQVTGGAQ